MSIDLAFGRETMDHEPFAVVLEEGKIFFLSLCCFAEVAEYRSPFRKTLHRPFSPSPSLRGGGSVGALSCLTGSKLAVNFVTISP